MAKRIPNELSVSLVNTDYDTFGVQASFVTRKFGIVEFLSYRPLYCLELYQIYKYARITAVQIELRVVNQSTSSPLMVALGFCPNADHSALTSDRAWETPGTVRRLMSVQGGMDRGVLKKTFVGQNCFGQPYLDQKYWIDVTQSASTSPVDVLEPVAYYIASSATGGAVPPCTIEWKTTYHIQFFDLRIPSSSLSQHDEQSFAEDQLETHCPDSHYVKELSEPSMDDNHSVRNMPHSVSRKMNDSFHKIDEHVESRRDLPLAKVLKRK